MVRRPGHWTKPRGKQMPSINVRSIIGVLIVLIVGLAVLPIVISSVTAAAACLTGSAQTMVNLIPLFYVIALLLAVIYWAVGTAKEK